VAGGIDDAFVAAVRERTSIVSVVGDYVSLRKSGASSFKGLCPFHTEKTPSFQVHEDRQFFYCFGCQTGGDVITFVREINGYSFVEAMRHLAERAGMELPEPSRDGGGASGARRRSRPSRETRDGLYQIGKAAQGFFRDTLHAMEGAAGRDYLRGRGVDSPTAERYGIGYAPDRWDGLIGALRAADIDLRQAESLGLIAPRSGGGGYYDRFRNRLTFPIRSMAGDVIAFGGRTLSTDKETPKYINSPDSPIYKKGEVLYGLFEARRALREAGYGLVVEGNLDVIRLAQFGFEHVVAPMGTALTEPQCRLLKRLVSRVVLLYDGDDAGRAAAEKAIPLSLHEGLHVSVVQLPDGEDPDSLVGSRGVDGLRELLEGAVPGFEYLVLHCVLPRLGPSPGAQGAAMAAREVAPALLAVRDDSERRVYQRQLADVLGLDEATVVRLLRDGARQGAGDGSPGARTASGPGRSAPQVQAPAPPSELRLLKLLMFAPEASSLYAAHDIGALLTHHGVRAAAELLAARWEDDPDFDVAAFVAELDDTSLRRSLSEALVAEQGASEWRPDFDRLVRRLRSEACERALEGLRRDERRAYLSGDDTAAARLQMERQALMRELDGLKATRG